MVSKPSTEGRASGDAHRKNQVCNGQTVFPPVVFSYKTCAAISFRVTNHITVCEETSKETPHRNFAFLVYGKDDGKGEGGRGEREA